MAPPPPAPGPPSPPTVERLRRGSTMITTNYSCRNYRRMKQSYGPALLSCVITENRINLIRHTAPVTVGMPRSFHSRASVDALTPARMREARAGCAQPRACSGGCGPSATGCARPRCPRRWSGRCCLSSSLRRRRSTRPHRSGLPACGSRMARSMSGTISALHSPRRSAVRIFSHSGRTTRYP